MTTWEVVVVMVVKRTKYRVFQKILTLVFSLIYPAINMLEGWDISHLKGGIHSSVWSTHFCHIKESR